MDIELPRAVRYLGLILMLIGLCVSLVGVAVPEPDPSITYVTEFDQEYAEQNSEEGFRVPIVGGNDGAIPPENVHSYYNSSNISEDVMSQLEENIGSEESFIGAEQDNKLYHGRFIVEFENGSKHVYEGEPDGLYPPDLYLYSLLISILGFLVYTSMRGTKAEIPQDVKPSKNDDWDYEIKK